MKVNDVHKGKSHDFLIPVKQNNRMVREIFESRGLNEVCKLRKVIQNIVNNNTQ